MEPKDIKISHAGYAGGSITIGIGALLEVLRNLVEWAKVVPQTVSGALLIVGAGAVGLAWWAARIDRRLAQLEMIARGAGRTIVSFRNNRTGWYREIARALDDAPNGEAVMDTTCNLRPTRTPGREETLARQQYREAVKRNRGRLTYQEVFSSNWDRDMMDVLRPLPESERNNVRVIPCSAPHFLFTDFVLVGDALFLSGLELTGGKELDLMILDENTADFFRRYFVELFKRARQVDIRDDRLKYERATDQWADLQATTRCS